MILILAFHDVVAVRINLVIIKNDTEFLENLTL